MAVNLGSFGATATGFLGNILSVGLWVFIGIVVICAVGGVMWFIKYKRSFDTTVIIRSERSGQMGTQVKPDEIKIGVMKKEDFEKQYPQGSRKIIFDIGAHKIDRTTKSWYFRLWHEKADLPAVPFFCIQQSSKGNVVEIWQKSHDEYIYLIPADIDILDYVAYDGKMYPIAQIKARQVEPNISYWNVKRKATMKKLFDYESLLIKPYKH